MVPSSSSLLRTLPATALSLSFSRGVILAIAIGYVFLHFLHFCLKLLLKYLQAKLKAQKASHEIVTALATAGVSRELLAHAISVTKYPLSVDHPDLDALRRLGAANKVFQIVYLTAGQSKRLAERRLRDAEHAEEQVPVGDEEQKAERRKVRLERLADYQRAEKLVNDAMDKMLQLPQSLAGTLI